MNHSADTLAKEAGTNLRAIARQWPTPRYGLREKQLQSRMTRIRRAAREGGLHYSAALRLANLLDCDVRIFSRGQEFFAAHFSEKAA
jgi:hypothetical protein